MTPSNLAIFREQYAPRTTRVVNTPDGTVTVYSALAVGVIEGKSRTIRALVCEEIGTEDRWFLVTLFVSGKYAQTVAVLGATSSEQAEEWVKRQFSYEYQGEYTSACSLASNGGPLTARANVLRFSEALAYHVHDPRHGFVQMPQRITFVHPTDGGVWVGQVDHVAFLAGSALGELTLHRKTAKAPVPGSATALDAEDAGDVAGGGGAVVAWLAENGYALGAPDGSVVEKHDRRLGGIAGNQGSSAVFANRLTTAII